MTIKEWTLLADTGEGRISVRWSRNDAEVILFNSSLGILTLDAKETGKRSTAHGCKMAELMGEAVDTALLAIKGGSKE